MEDLRSLRQNTVASSLIGIALHILLRHAVLAKLKRRLFATKIFIDYLEFTTDHTFDVGKNDHKHVVNRVEMPGLDIGCLTNPAEVDLREVRGEASRKQTLASDFLNLA